MLLKIMLFKGIKFLKRIIVFYNFSNKIYTILIKFIFKNFIKKYKKLLATFIFMTKMIIAQEFYVCM